MSQNMAYRALRKFDGWVRMDTLRDQIAADYPDSQLPKYLSNRLRKLESKEVVEINDDVWPFEVRIIDHEWSGIDDEFVDGPA